MKPLREIVPLQEGHFSRNRNAYIGGALGTVIGGAIGIPSAGIGAVGGMLLDMKRHAKNVKKRKYKTAKAAYDDRPVLTKLRDAKGVDW